LGRGNGWKVSGTGREWEARTREVMTGKEDRRGEKGTGEKGQGRDGRRRKGRGGRWQRTASPYKNPGSATIEN